MIAFQKGINLGGWLSQCNHTKNRYETFITEEDFKRIADWGFDHVRVPFDYNLLETDAGELLDRNFEYLDRALLWGKSHGLNVILDLHKTAGYDFNDFGNAERNILFESDSAQERFLSLWDRVSKRYASRPNVAFELLNEVTDLSFVGPWNDLIVKAVRRIRQNAAETPIIYGGVCWNSAAYVSRLVPPPAKNVIYTFHLYEPLLFTHQKAPWVKALDNGKDIPYTSDMEFFRKNSESLGFVGENLLRSSAKTMGPEFFADFLREAITYAKSQNVPLYCGEYGVIDRADPDETVKWFRDVHEVFKRFDIGSALWSYKEMDFGFCGAHYAKLREFLGKSSHKD